MYKHALFPFYIALAWYAAGADLAMSADQKVAAKTALPDWSGVWANSSGVLYSKANREPNPPPLTPEYAARWKVATDMAAAGKAINDPTANCIWPGVPRLAVIAYPMEFVISPKRVTILYEYMSQVRRIWTDGRSHPADLDPTFNGDSIGHWEGETLVVDTVGLRPDTVYEYTGLPHSDQLRIQERIWKSSPDNLEVEVTAFDPKALTKPWVTRFHYLRHADWHIMEFVCEENNRNPVNSEGQTVILDGNGKPIEPGQH